MASLDDELLLDAEEDARTIAYIRQHLPAALQEAWDDELLYYFLDLIVEYYAESGILEATPDKDGYVEIDVERVAEHVAAKAKKEKMGDFAPEDLLLVVQAELDCQEE